MMNKPGAGIRPGVAGAGSGPTAAAAAAAAEKQRTFLQRADADINAILDNFSHLVKAARVNDATYRNSQEALQMDIHASRVVSGADSLLKLVSELKQTAVFSDFASLNQHVDQRTATFERQCNETDRLLGTVGEQAAVSLRELEEHYYSSAQNCPNKL